MSRLFKTALLDDASWSQALPLLRATWPELDLQGWREFASGFADSPDLSKRIVGLFDSSGGLCGLFACRVDQALRDGQILAIPLFTVVDLANSLEPVRALLTAAKERAELCHCKRLRIELDHGQKGLARRVNSLGATRHGTFHSIELSDISTAK